MNRPEINIPAVEEDTDSVIPAASWGEKEEARQIALLDAVVRLDKIHHVIDKVAASEESGRYDVAPDALTSDIDEELSRCYLDYALSVIVNRALDPEIAAGKLRVVARRGMYVHCPSDYNRLNFREIQKQVLTSALAILRLKQAAKNGRISALLVKLINAAKSATCRLPLFAYGPELSEYRHRIR